MKVVAFVIALTLAVSTFALAANPSTKTTNNANTTNNMNTSSDWNNANTQNNNTTNNANTNNANTNNTNTNNANTNNTNTNIANPVNNTQNNNTNNANNNTNANTTINNTNTSTQQLLKVSQDGFAAIRAVRAARVAIFTGQPNVATEMLNQAKTNLEAAAKNAPQYAANTETTVNGTTATNETTVGAMKWILIDGQVSLAETVAVPTEKAEHIQKANQYFNNGQSKEAIEQLRLAAIDVSCTRVLMPLASTTKYVAEATKLVGQQKYYEANLALKAVEDGLVVNSSSLIEMPQVNTQNVNQNN